MDLSVSQKAAIEYINAYASSLQSSGLAELDNVLGMSNISPETYIETLQQIKENARIGLQFHPDRISKNGKSVVQAMREDGLYKNQFETHVSNGKLEPAAGGVRAKWEDRIFGDVFSKYNASLSERPKYGALDLMLFPDGPCPRFGSCYFLLKPAVSQRSTFTFMDSHRDPLEKGTLQVFEPILAALMTECFERRFALGRTNISPTELVEHLTDRLQLPFEDPNGKEAGRNLNHYIEAQVFGDISLLEDVDILAADPSFKNTAVEQDFIFLCEKFQINLFWHSGFRLPLKDVPDNFRGPGMPSLAARISEKDYVDAYRIGRAAADLKRNPSAWADRGSVQAVLQELKILWHVLVQFGETIRQDTAC